MEFRISTTPCISSHALYLYIKIKLLTFAADHLFGSAETEGAHPALSVAFAGLHHSFSAVPPMPHVLGSSYLQGHFFCMFCPEKKN